MTVNRYVIETDPLSEEVKTTGFKDLTDKEQCKLLEEIFTQGINRLGYEKAIILRKELS